MLECSFYFSTKHPLEENVIISFVHGICNGMVNNRIIMKNNVDLLTI